MVDREKARGQFDWDKQQRESRLEHVKPLARKATIFGICGWGLVICGSAGLLGDNISLRVGVGLIGFGLASLITALWFACEVMAAERDAQSEPPLWVDKIFDRLAYHESQLEEAIERERRRR